MTKKTKNNGRTFHTASGSFRGRHCVAVSVGNADVLVRHSKKPDAGTIRFTRGEWRAFVQGVKADEFNLG